jgi:hypothetical protein
VVATLAVSLDYSPVVLEPVFLGSAGRSRRDWAVSMGVGGSRLSAGVADNAWRAVVGRSVSLWARRTKLLLVIDERD